MGNLFYFKTFVDAAAMGSFHAAAAKNYISQPAVTQHIRLLEEKLECKLFERQNRSIVLTAAGKIFLDYAESILKQYEEAKTKVGELYKQFRGTVRIATIYSAGLYTLPPLVRHYLKRYPKIDIHLEYHLSEEIHELVRKGVVDFGFVSFPARKPGVIAEIFAEETLVLAQSTDARVFKNKKIRLEELSGAKFVGFTFSSPTGRAIRHFLKNRGVTPRLINEYDNVETLKSAVLLGLGCSFLPKNTVMREIKERSLEIIHVEGFALKRPLGILRQKSKILTESARAFYQIITDNSHPPLPDQGSR